MAAAGAIRHGHLPNGNLVALHEATDALHWAMRPALHHRIHMAIKIASV
jgi:hypothetical protein